MQITADVPLPILLADILADVEQAERAADNAGAWEHAKKYHTAGSLIALAVNVILDTDPDEA